MVSPALCRSQPPLRPGVRPLRSVCQARAWRSVRLEAAEAGDNFLAEQADRAHHVVLAEEAEVELAEERVKKALAGVALQLLCDRGRRADQADVVLPHVRWVREMLQ